EWASGRGGDRRSRTDDGPEGEYFYAAIRRSARAHGAVGYARCIERGLRDNRMSGRSGIGREAKDVGQNAIVHQRVLAENVEVGLLDFLPVDGVLILGFRH